MTSRRRRRGGGRRRRRRLKLEEKKGLLILPRQTAGSLPGICLKAYCQFMQQGQNLLSFCSSISLKFWSLIVLLTFGISIFSCFYIYLYISGIKYFGVLDLCTFSVFQSFYALSFCV